MSEVFLYTREADINSMHLKALRAAGYITVKVASMNAVKQMPSPLPLARVDLVTEAMAHGINASRIAAETFGATLAQLLIKSAQDLRAASAIEAASADETRSGSAEGESAAPEGGDAQ